MITVLVPYFNPCGSSLRRDVYCKFRDSLEKYNKDVEILTLELAFERRDVPDSICFQATENNFMWQKEALLNIGLNRLSNKTEFVAWIDSDLDLGYSLEEVIPLLKAHNFVQLFREIEYLEENSLKPGRVFRVQETNLKPNEYPGCPGGAWIAKRSKFPYIYDRCIVGGGDTPFCDHIMGHETSVYWNYANDIQREDFQNKVTLPRGRVTYFDRRIYHFYHGKLVNRQYSSRHKILKNFNPSVHIQKDSNGVLEFTEHAPKQMKEGLRKYFFDRKEE